MSIIPAFEIGVWNAWIITVFLVLTGVVPGFFISKERMDKMGKWPPLNKTEKILALSTHVVIMPAAAVYSIFLPLQLGTVWFYVGLPICFLAGVMVVIAYINIINTPPDEPAIKGAYHISRHPMYFSGFLIYLGTGIAAASWLFLLFAAAWIIMWHIVVPAEERGLVEEYGDAYREYINRTPRWMGIPKSGNKR
jgi:protein-S-isoprenylcysteine O-methyltransferase Ste14